MRLALADRTALHAGWTGTAAALARLRRRLGGVGSWAAEAVARSGIGELTLVDLMTFASATSAANYTHSTESWKTEGRSNGAPHSGD